MPLLDYNNVAAEWTAIGEINHKKVFETMLDAPVGSSRKDFIRLLDADTHFGKSASQFMRGRGEVATPGGQHPSALIRNRITKTPMGFAIGVNIVAVGFAKITMEESMKLTKLNDEQAFNECNLMLLALLKTCRKMETKTFPSRPNTFRKLDNNKKRVRICGYSRA